MSEQRALESDTPSRVLIDAVAPIVDGGRHPVKHVVGEPFSVSATLVIDGHDVAGGALLYRKVREARFREVALVAAGNDVFRAAFTPDSTGRWEYSVAGWLDGFASWRRGFARKVEAKQVAPVDLEDGLALARACASRAAARGAAGEAGARADADAIGAVLAAFAAREAPPERRAQLVLDETLAAACARHPDRRGAVRREPPLVLVVDPLRARFSAWYELFPRSTGAPGQHGTLRDAAARLDYVAGLGFDVVYLPPIHPIGVSFRKGKNNRLEATPGDVGSPWAIGGEAGGHDAIHPALGTLADFEAFVARARRLGLEVAIDLAWQAAPDHPWVKQHPEWFVHRADGTIQPAENPPKKYPDVYPFALAGDAWQPLWRALLETVETWIARGVSVFRVDNPHTKPLPFWAWLIGEVKRAHPDVIFLAEAFTRPTLMYALAKLGFSQSYTYFTWRTTRQELTDYLTEITRPPVSDYFRPNLWPNTPDILPEHLQHGGRPAFIARAVLAATLSASWGVYGPAFELGERVARPGSEEYVDNEKYELRSWNLGDPTSLAPILARLNRLRREHPALQRNDTLRFHPTDNEHLIAYSKSGGKSGGNSAGDDVILVVVNLDPHHRHAGWIDLDLAGAGTDTLQAHDLLSEARYAWHGRRGFVELDPTVFPAHVFKLRRLVRSEHDFEYFA